jgi:endogenous inhibitor of DNA gyrase (YacG/DUF329 family)
MPWVKGQRAHNNKNHMVTCKTCGKVFNSSPSNNRKFCSKKCFHNDKKEWLQGKNHPMWNGGVSISTDGYLRRSDDKFVHRHLIELKIGRKLTNNEVIHHINRNRQDNRLENLVIMTREEHINFHRKDLHAYSAQY